MLNILNEPGWEIGIDEVGRGCLIGPVVACALVLPSQSEIDKNKEIWSQVKDSKKVSEKKRKELYEFITKNVPAYGIGFVSEKDIDSINILKATMKAMHIALDTAVRKISEEELYQQKKDMPVLNILVDGPHFKPYMPPGEEEQWTIKQKCVVEGDATYLSIA